jgi:hypothetical protein
MSKKIELRPLISGFDFALNSQEDTRSSNFFALGLFNVKKMIAKLKTMFQNITLISPKIELRPLISGFDFALLEVRNLCVASRLSSK